MMISVAEAKALIAVEEQCFGFEKVSVVEACGRTLAEDILSDRDFPPFNRVAMDGIAVRYDEFLDGQREFQVHGIQAAGYEALTLDPNLLNGCIEVMTGAVMPCGVDTVIPFELVSNEKRGGHDFAILADDLSIQDKQNIHFRASDSAQGTLQIAKNTQVNMTHVAIMLSCGLNEILVAARPRVALVSTGDELVGAGDSVQPWQIRRSNMPSIYSDLLGRGFEALSDQHIADDEAVLKERLGELLESNDILIMSGGVSKGKFDFVPQTLESLGLKKVFHCVKQRPGKPFFFAAGEFQGKKKLVFALPGNPVSTMATYRYYVLPYLYACQGIQPAQKKVLLGQPHRFAKAMTQFMPVKFSHYDDAGSAVVNLRKSNGSGDFASLADSDGFVVLLEELQDYPVGLVVNFYSWTDF